jgi:nitrogen regulatory protein PII
VRKIEAIISRHKLEEVREALTAAGILGLTITEVHDFRAHEGSTEIYRTAKYKNEYLAKIKIETVVSQHLVPTAVSILARKDQAGQAGNDRILISTVNDASRTYHSGLGDAS